MLESFSTIRARLAVVVSHPIQYYSPWFRWLAAQTALELKVFYLWDAGARERHDEQFGQAVKWDTDLLSGYESEFVPNSARHPNTEHFFGLHNPELLPRLRQWRPDAILLFGYNYRTHLHLIRHAPAPLIFRGDSNLLSRHQMSFIKKWLLTAIYRRFAAVTYVGEANRRYFSHYGVPAHKLHFAPHCVDHTQFKPGPAIDAKAASLRDTLHLTGKKIVLFAGKLTAWKQPRQLLEAFVQSAGPNDALVFVGDGAEKAVLQAVAAKHSDFNVRFLPFANQSEMPAVYRMADLLALPSQAETWGLVVNEAMHMGLPCLVNNRAGCQLDLVTDGKTGWVYPAEETGALATTLRRALQSDMNAMRPAIAERISHYTYRQATDGLLAALHAVITRADST